MSTGKPSAVANRVPSPGPSNDSVPGTTCSPAACITPRARALSPSRCKTWGVGPMNTMPAAWHASASEALSDKNPYPGWRASAPVIAAAVKMAGMLR